MPCVHEFCLLPEAPGPEEEFAYAPERYPDRTAVDDDLLNEWAGRRRDALWAVPVYFESLHRPEKGFKGAVQLPAEIPEDNELFPAPPGKFTGGINHPHPIA